MPATEPQETFPTGDKEEYGSKNHDQEQLSVQIVYMPYDASEKDCYRSWKNVIVRRACPD